MSIKSKDPLYFIALMPPARIRNEIENFKKEIKAKFGIQHALKLPAHITLQIPFRMSDNQAKILMKKLEKFCHENVAFETTLDGFGKFGKQVIFIKVKDHKPYFLLFEDLQKLILNFIDLKKHEIASKIHPHITIATRDLKRSAFPEIWDEFKNRDYNNSYQIKDLYLLKHNGKTWDVVRKFELAY